MTTTLNPSTLPTQAIVTHESLVRERTKRKKYRRDFSLSLSLARSRSRSRSRSRFPCACRASPLPCTFRPPPHARRGATDAYGDDEARKAAILFGVTIAIFIITAVYYQFIDPMAPDYWNLHRIVDSGYFSKLASAKQRAVERAEALQQHTSPRRPLPSAEGISGRATLAEAAEATRLLRGAFASPIGNAPPKMRQE